MSRFARKLARCRRLIMRRLKKTNDNKYRRYAEGAGPVIAHLGIRYCFHSKLLTNGITAKP
jgi:hypothetical protein